MQGVLYEEQNNFSHRRVSIFPFGDVSRRRDSENNRKFGYFIGNRSDGDPERHANAESETDRFAERDAESVNRADADAERNAGASARTVGFAFADAGTERHADRNAESVRFADTISETFGNAVCDAESERHAVGFADTEILKNRTSLFIV